MTEFSENSEINAFIFSPENCWANVKPYVYDYQGAIRVGKKTKADCPNLTSLKDQVPFLIPSAVQRIKTITSDPTQSNHHNCESICMRTDCLDNRPVGIRAFPVVGQLIRSREKPTNLSMLTKKK